MVTLTKTTISDFLACEKKYYIGQVIGYQRKDKPKTMVIGTMLHMAKELLSKGMGPPQTKLEIQKEIATIFKQGAFDSDTCKEIESIAFNGAMYSPWPTLDGAEYEKTISIPMNDLLGENKFNLPDDFRFGGKIDEVVPLRDSMHLIDYKTKDTLSNIGLSWFSKVISLDLQQILYRIAYTKLFNVNVSRFEFRYIKRPGIRIKKGENHETYLNRIWAEYSNVKNIDKYYASCDAPDHNSHIVMNNFQSILSRLVKRYESGGWEMNPLSCISYNHACRYLPICYCEPGWKDLYDDFGPDHHPELERKDEKRERTEESGNDEF